MSPHKVHIVDMEELMELLEEITSEERICSKDEAFERYARACRTAYSVTRDAMTNGRAAALHAHANKTMSEQSGVNAAIACLIMQAVSEYLEIEQQKDPEKFKTQFIFCLDKAIQDAGANLEEAHDTRTESSAEERSAQSPATP